MYSYYFFSLFLWKIFTIIKFHITFERTNRNVRKKSIINKIHVVYFIFTFTWKLNWNYKINIFSKISTFYVLWKQTWQSRSNRHETKLQKIFDQVRDYIRSTQRKKCANNNHHYFNNLKWKTRIQNSKRMTQKKMMMKNSINLQDEFWTKIFQIFWSKCLI